MFIIDTPVAETVNPYTEDVAQLIAAGEGKSAAYDVEKGELNDKGESKVLASLKLKFQRAANAADRTARSRIVSETDTNVTIAFTLKPKQKGRGSETAETETAETETAAPEVTDTPKPKGK